MKNNCFDVECCLCLPLVLWYSINILIHKKMVILICMNLEFWSIYHTNNNKVKVKVANVGMQPLSLHVLHLNTILTHINIKNVHRIMIRPNIINRVSCHLLSIPPIPTILSAALHSFDIVSHVIWWLIFRRSKINIVCNCWCLMLQLQSQSHFPRWLFDPIPVSRSAWHHA